MNSAAAAVIQQFGLQPHPEGGWFREIFRSSHTVRVKGSERTAMTVIHYLLASDMHSAWHRVDADEAWIFSDGSPIELFMATPDFQTVTRCRLIDSTPVSVVPAGWWQAAYTEGDWALVQCTVAPGFEYDGFELARNTPFSDGIRDDLVHLL